MKTIWFDFANPPHVNFYNPIIKKFRDDGYNIKCTARDFAETLELLKMHNIDYRLFGRYGGKRKINKIFLFLSRELKLITQVGHFDFSFSSNYESPLISWIRGKTALVFDDNDISPNWLYSRFAKYVISPKYIDRGAMFKMGIRPHQLLTYDGFKENIYIADYTPDPDFLLNIPFRDFVTVRPENIQATYVADGVKSIVPELVQKLVAKGINVLYLPRYQSDKDMVLKSDNVFIPSKPLNGLDVCYYSQAILTGAGSFSREAAVLGTPAVSFFAGKNFLGVDKEMIKRMMVLYSRDPDEIANHVKSAGKREFNQNISKAVQEELFFILQKAMISGD